MLDRATGLKARETRRQVFLRARMRAGGGLGEICIRNISTRGMLLQAAAPPPRGTYIEILLPAHTVVARVVWVKDRRFGVHTRDAMDLNTLLGMAGLGEAASRRPDTPVAALAPKSGALTLAQLRERHERSRRLSSWFEFAFMAVCAAAIAAVAVEAIYDRFRGTVEEVKARL